MTPEDRLSEATKQLLIAAGDEDVSPYQAHAIQGAVCIIQEIRRAVADDHVQFGEMKEKYRNEWIESLKSVGMTGEEIGDLPVIDLSGSRVNQIARGNNDD